MLKATTKPRKEQAAVTVTRQTSTAGARPCIYVSPIEFCEGQRVEDEGSKMYGIRATVPNTRVDRQFGLGRGTWAHLLAASGFTAGATLTSENLGGGCRACDCSDQRGLRKGTTLEMVMDLEVTAKAQPLWQYMKAFLAQVSVQVIGSIILEPTELISAAGCIPQISLWSQTAWTASSFPVGSPPHASFFGEKSARGSYTTKILQAPQEYLSIRRPGRGFFLCCSLRRKHSPFDWDLAITEHQSSRWTLTYCWCQAKLHAFFSSSKH